MSPMKERRTLLTHAWLIYEADGQMPRQVNLAIIRRWLATPACSACEEIGLPKLFRFTIWDTRKLCSLG